MPTSRRPASKAPAGRAQSASASKAQGRPASKAKVGDWIETHGLPGKPSRRGQIVELLGSAEHERFRVRWDERHESIVYPADGVLVAPARSSRARRPRG